MALAAPTYSGRHSVGSVKRKSTMAHNTERRRLGSREATTVATVVKSGPPATAAESGGVEEFAASETESAGHTQVHNDGKCRVQKVSPNLKFKFDLKVKRQLKHGVHVCSP
jgi:hypothetical protein